ncbi:sporulation protein [Kitasatospora sp. NPDC059673]|uniref:sporulation protein n=1 Tax=Kitasatospora sp. NPDC059673 TaxID=3346901 RepID=UPI00369F5C0B
MRGRFGFGREGAQPDPSAVELVLGELELTDQWVTGHVVIRAGGRALELQGLDARLVADAYDEDGGRSELEIGWLDVGDSWFTLAPGEERQVTFRRRLSWECPFTEYGGQDFGIGLAVRATLNTRAGELGFRSEAALRVPPPVAVAAAIGAFGELGYTERSARVIADYIPDSDQYNEGYQSLFLTDPARGKRKLPRLELSFVTNAVGTMVHLRRAAPNLYEWASKPKTVTFAVAHHEVAHADLAARAGAALEDLRALYRT